MTSKASASLPPKPLRMGQRLYDLEKLDDRARPAMADEERHRIGPATLLMDEMQVEPVHRRRELREPVDGGLLGPPVEMLQPIGAKLFHIGEIGAVLPAIEIGHGVPGKGRDPDADLIRASSGTAIWKGVGAAMMLSSVFWGRNPIASLAGAHCQISAIFGSGEFGSSTAMPVAGILSRTRPALLNNRNIPSDNVPDLIRTQGDVACRCTIALDPGSLTFLHQIRDLEESRVREFSNFSGLGSASVGLNPGRHGGRENGRCEPASHVESPSRRTWRCCSVARRNKGGNI